MTKKQEAWKLFSIFIRKRDGKGSEYPTCVTCDNRRHWKNMDAGHFISSVHTSIKFDERNVHAQCRNCNGPLGGNLKVYSEFMEKTYGKEVMAELRRKSHVIIKPDYDAIIERYKR